MVSPLGVVPKARTGKFRLAVNMRFVNRHLGNKAFKIKGLKELADLAERGDHAMSYDLMSGYYHVGSLPGVANLCRLRVGRRVLRVQLPSLWAFDGPLGLFKGDA